MSIGTLIAYTTVSASIIVVRYQKPGVDQAAVSGAGVNEAVSTLAANIEEGDGGGGTATEEEGAGEEEKLLSAPESASERPSIRNAFADVVNSKVLLSSLDRFFHDSLISVAVFLIVLFTVLFCLTCKLFNKVSCEDGFVF